MDPDSCAESQRREQDPANIGLLVIFLKEIVVKQIILVEMLDISTKGTV